CFYNDPATPQLSTLSLHDALPISDVAVHVVQTEWIGRVRTDLRRALEVRSAVGHAVRIVAIEIGFPRGQGHTARERHWQRGTARSEEHTSELQSRGHLVCRLLLEK